MASNKVHKVIGLDNFHAELGRLVYRGPAPSNEHQAWLISLAKWYILRYGDEMLADGGDLTCGLCMLYIDLDSGCSHCPAADDAGCKGTPYYEYTSGNTAAAERELVHLVSRMAQSKLADHMGKHYLTESGDGLALWYKNMPLGPEDALLESIAKWVHIYLHVARTGEQVKLGAGGSTCGLCIYYDSCTSCPVTGALGRIASQCRGTPYYDYAHGGDDPAKSAIEEVMLLLAMYVNEYAPFEEGLDQLEVGDQVEYLGWYGFVTEVHNTVVRCRFWKPGSPGVLRASISETVRWPNANLKKSHDFVSRSDVHVIMKALGDV